MCGSPDARDGKCTSTSASCTSATTFALVLLGFRVLCLYPLADAERPFLGAALARARVGNLSGETSALAGSAASGGASDACVAAVCLGAPLEDNLELVARRSCTSTTAARQGRLSARQQILSHDHAENW